jgi:phosphate transport system protein
MAKEMRNEIIKLKKDVLNMAQLAENMLNDSVEALIKTDLELAETVDPKKHKLRKFDENIEREALRTIALYQPMAIDLRRLASVLKIITYLYRIGRYGKDIAAVVEEFTEKHPYSEFIGIKHMWEHVRTMIKDAMDSFDSETTSKLEDFEERDNEIDQMRWSIFRESVSYMMEDPKNITASAHLMMIARYLERCGDHACKIAEKTYYLVEGQHKEIS